MKKLTGFYGILAIFLLLVVVGVIGNQLFYDLLVNKPTDVELWLHAIGLLTLTQFESGIIFATQSSGFQIFSTILTQISSILFHSILLWLCWQLFGSSGEKQFSLKKSTSTASLIIVGSELLMLAFFLYGIPNELTGGNFSTKLLAALTLSINSFNNAGFSNWHFFFGEGILAGNFMIQVGIIGGSVFGSLGIFVIIDLFSPIKLRERLVSPLTDWNFLTKISVFGTAALLVFYISAYFLFGNADVLINKNALETISFILMEGASARGFGLELIEGSSGIFEIVNAAITFFGAGPFSTGGGATLLFFVFLMAISKGQKQLSKHMQIGMQLIKVWLVISAVYLAAIFLITLIGRMSISIPELFYLYTNNHMQLSGNEDVCSGVIKTITMVVGRWSFIASCFIIIHQNKHASGII